MPDRSPVPLIPRHPPDDMVLRLELLRDEAKDLGLLKPSADVSQASNDNPAEVSFPGQVLSCSRCAARRSNSCSGS